MLRYETIDSNTLDLLKTLQLSPCLNETRLVGGTALALQIGHRKSIDLDLFGVIACDPIELMQELRSCGDFSSRGSSRRIHRFLVRGVQVDIVHYDYPWLDDPIRCDGLRLAGCRDIVAMKLAAVTNRGSRKDFIDLAFLLDRFSLQEMLDLYAAKFPGGSCFAVLKSLVFFDDAEDDPMPYMLQTINWPEVKQRIIEAVRLTSQDPTKN
jgi:hypothetical protein